MPARHLNQDTTITQCYEEIGFTLVKTQSSSLAAHPTLIHYQAKFKGMLERCKAIFLEELDLVLRKITTRAGVEHSDDLLNDIVDEVDRETRTKSETMIALRELFFGKESPSVIKKPTLGKQLETMRGWISILLSPNVPANLRPIGLALEKYIANADQATKALKEFSIDNRDFRAIGARKLFIDDLNQLRKEASGDLDKLPGELKDLALPRNLSSRYFLRDASSYDGPVDLDQQVEETQAQLHDAKDNVAVLEARLQDLTAQKAKIDQEEADRHAQDAEIAEAQRRLDELKAKRTKR